MTVGPDYRRANGKLGKRTSDQVVTTETAYVLKAICEHGLFGKDRRLARDLWRKYTQAKPDLRAEFLYAFGGPNTGRPSERVASAVRSAARMMQADEIAEGQPKLAQLVLRLFLPVRDLKMIERDLEEAYVDDLEDESCGPRRAKFRYWKRVSINVAWFIRERAFVWSRLLPGGTPWRR